VYLQNITFLLFSCPLRALDQKWGSEIFLQGRDREEETEMVMRQSRRDRGNRHMRNGWKETKGNRLRGTVREEETERKDCGRDRGKRKSRETNEERPKEMEGKRQKGQIGRKRQRGEMEVKRQREETEGRCT
jgi:TolA-binding protein